MDLETLKELADLKFLFEEEGHSHYKGKVGAEEATIIRNECLSYYDEQEEEFVPGNRKSTHTGVKPLENIFEEGVYDPFGAPPWRFSDRNNTLVLAEGGHRSKAILGKKGKFTILVEISSKTPHGIQETLRSRVWTVNDHLVINGVDIPKANHILSPILRLVETNPKEVAALTAAWKASFIVKSPIIQQLGREYDTYAKDPDFPRNPAAVISGAAVIWYLEGEEKCRSFLDLCLGFNKKDGTPVSHLRRSLNRNNDETLNMDNAQMRVWRTVYDFIKKSYYIKKTIQNKTWAKGPHDMRQLLDKYEAGRDLKARIKRKSEDVE